MKFSTKLVAIFCLLPGAAATDSNASNIRGAKDGSSWRPPGETHGRTLNNGEVGTFLIADIEYEWYEGDDSRRKLHENGGDGRPHHIMNIELENGLIYSLDNLDPSWTDTKGKRLKSGLDRIEISPGAIASGSKIDLLGGAPEVLDRGQANNGGMSENHDGRRLDPYRNPRTHGDKTVLAVRVVAGDGTSYSSSASQLSNTIFGDGGNDVVSFASQFEACSHGQLTFSRAEDRAMEDPSPGSTGISDGIVTIRVDTLPSEGNPEMRNAVTAKLTEVFGAEPKRLATYVMYCLPPGVLDGVAYAYVDSWLSVYNDGWCNSLTAKMHEIGHNLDFAHSGEGGNEYDDMSGVMGYSSDGSNGPQMCINGAKTYQAEWYQESTRVIAPTQGVGGVNLDTCYDGALYGIPDYDGSSARTVLVKIDDAYNDTDYYVMFNRKTGFNSGTTEGGDQVLITTTGEEGEDYSTSALVAKLNAGQSYTIGNFEGSGKDVVVDVDWIETISNPNLAQVRIQYAGVPCGSPPPTSSPTSDTECIAQQGTRRLRVNVLTDNHPEDTSWTLVNTCTGAVEKSSSADLSSPYTEKLADYQDQWCVPETEYTFTISDLYDDGICCSQGSGSYAVLYGSDIVARGGQFGSSQSTTFGSCPPSTSNPTNSPMPTPSPTSFTCDAQQGTHHIRVNVLTDNYPGETSWTLKNTCTGAVEKSSDADLTRPYNAQSTNYEDQWCVPEAEYTFTINDAYSDGICCGYGSGSYGVLYGGDYVAQGGQFESSESTTFGSCPTESPSISNSPSTLNPTESPTPPPTNATECDAQQGIHSIRVNILTDKYPAETSWTLVNTCTGAEEKSSAADLTSPYSAQFTSYQHHWCVHEAQYTFTIKDSWFDGICCSHGEGSYDVHYGGNLVAHGGQFSYSESTTFGSCALDIPLPPNPTKSPTLPPTGAPSPPPTIGPSKSPTDEPTASPSRVPTNQPSTPSPTKSPTLQPTSSQPTSSPLEPPTSQPTTSPTHDTSCDAQQGMVRARVNVLTDKYPAETSWTLVNTCTGLVEKSSAADLSNPYSTMYTNYQDQWCVPEADYKFIIIDSYGNGICCSQGNGSYDVLYGSHIVAQGGQFGSSESTTFGSCPTNSPTTSNPTESPTPSPTEAPSSSPTIGPSKSPTDEPTASPSKVPTNQPSTPSPTKSPTLKPTMSSQPTPSSIHDTMCDDLQGTRYFRLNVLTDKYPAETSWTLVNTCTRAMEKSSAIDLSNPYSERHTIYQDQWCVPEAEYTFTINDAYSDGICCSQGSGSYDVLYGSDIVAQGGQFGSSEGKTFGSCPMSSPTTSNPTKLPLPLPTDAPSPLPTISPSKSPTDAPTTTPSRASTNQPSTPNPTKSPTLKPTMIVQPTPSPTHNTVCDTQQGMHHFEVNVLSDEYPSETSWTLINSCTRAVEKSSTVDLGSPYNAKNTNFHYQFCVPEAQYTFIINDSWGDGICCSNGNGSYNVVYGSDIVAQGDQFGSSESATFGSCSTNSPSTSNPTKLPTQSPTAEPSFPPTISPSKSPTSEPTSSPSRAPTNQPNTPIPTKSPTLKPTDEPTTTPSKAPTDQPNISPSTAPQTPSFIHDTACDGQQSTRHFKVNVLTDNYPSETSWTLVNTCTGDIEISSAANLTSRYSAKLTNYQDLWCIPEAEYTFTIIDSWGDGICCWQGSGSYDVHYGGEFVAQGDRFFSSESTTFGSCSTDTMDSPPTSNPTKSPTAPPTDSPSISPSKSPTKDPTAPSRAPTNQPTSSRPTKSPTLNPTTTSQPTSSTPETLCDAQQGMRHFQVNVFTDNYPEETSWTLNNTCTGAVEISSASELTPYTAKLTNHQHQWCVPEAEYTFTINDSYNDGICCGYGTGSYDVHYRGDYVTQGGEFGGSESTTFGSCLS